MTPPTPPVTVGTAGAAKLLNVSERTVQNLADRGVLPHHTDHAGRRIYLVSEVERVATERERS